MADEKKDKLGMAVEWEEAPAPANQQPAQQQPQEFSREIDLGDGAGKQVFKAESYEALCDKLADAQANATRKIRELSRERRMREPEKQSSDWAELRPTALKADELASVQSNPHEHFRRLFQAETGLSPEEFRVRENERRRSEAELSARRDFVRRHQDYNDSADNGNRIIRFLEEQNLPVSKRNLDYAYEELRGELIGKSPAPAPAPPRQPEAAREPQTPPRNESRSTPPSFIRPSLGGRSPVDEGGASDAEIARIAQSSSLPEMKSRIEAYFRAQRGSAR
jgi:AraC-like DNA-binding protein